MLQAVHLNLAIAQKCQRSTVDLLQQVHLPSMSCLDALECICVHRSAHEGLAMHMQCAKAVRL